MNESPRPSPPPEPLESPRWAWPLPPATLAGFLVAFVAVGVIGSVTAQAMASRMAAGDLVTHSRETRAALDAVIANLTEAETSQRGYLLTGDEKHLAPFSRDSAAITDQLATARRLIAEQPEQLKRVTQLTALVTDKFAELGQTITLRREGKVAEGIAVVRSDRGRAMMEEIRDLVDQMQTDEKAQLDQRQAAWRRTVDLAAAVNTGGSALLLALIALAALLAARDSRVRETEVWLRQGLMGLNTAMQGEQRLEVLGANVLSYLAARLDAQVGALHLVDDDGSFHRVAGFALPASLAPGRYQPGEGLVGQAARDVKVLHVRSLPEGYLPITSSLGTGKPQELLLAPAVLDGEALAVVELGLLRTAEPRALELLGRASWSIAMAIASSKDRTRLEALLQETQRQAEELQSQQEELRVSNEELEEQSHALKDSQARLEAQQAELEQTNAHLEQQAQALERQKEELLISQGVLTEKSAELERVNQYKSEFLANMSHELRTPLNSSLILAKLLADNKGGNLTPEQVGFAQTITSAGHDLLALINDILDLSKIEAGKVELHPAPLELARSLEVLAAPFRLAAKQKGLQLSVVVAAGTPAMLETDAQRFGQVIKNLLSNALKFTERGEISLRAAPSAEGLVDLVVADTGIGIAAHQHEVIFEAFRQADGSTQRRFGGTGLGLSISRDLARLLGGSLGVKSVPGQGSAFTLTLPVRYVAPATPEAPAPTKPSAPPAQAPAAPPSDALQPSSVPDDRERLSPGARVILIVEDDLRFAAILRDLARELGFQAVLTQTASDGLAATTRYQPNAIVLDVNLPDHSGLGALDQLKRNPLTRHIPVHVVSVGDYAKQALELGAVGYALKPVRREDLVEAFRLLEQKFSQDLRRVLVVEDDQRQREAVRELLSADDVQIVTVDSGGAALAALEAGPFDCVVLDLNLPDVSGLQVLEQLAAREGPGVRTPVIVHTGRSLSRPEEQHLLRFSRTIILKDERSPERLLDEVTLFLHHVEAKLPASQQRLLTQARVREAALEGRRLLLVEDDVRAVFALSSVFEQHGVVVQIARNGREALDALEGSVGGEAIDLVLMDIMMPEMDGLTATREIRKRAAWKKLPIIAVTAKAMRDDHERCLAAGANDYISKPVDVEKLLSLVRVWMPRVSS